MIINTQQNPRTTRSKSRSKRVFQDVDGGSTGGSETYTWGRLAKERKKRKYMNIDLAGYYSETDFGKSKDETHWKIREVDMTRAFRKRSN